MIAYDIQVKWASNGWLTGEGNPASNVDLWRPLLFFNQKYNLVLRWVKGHAGDWGNELADQLAWKAARGDQFVPDKGYKSLKKNTNSGHR